MIIVDESGHKTHDLPLKVTFAVYMLAEHPHVLRKLRSEILSRLGSQRRPEPEDFREMKYLRAVINGKSHSVTVRSDAQRGCIRNAATIPNRVCPIID